MSTNELLYHAMSEVGPQMEQLKRDPKIDNAILKVTGYHPDDLMAKSKKIEFVEPRQIGMYFYRKSGYSLELSGVRFGRNHATVVHASKKIEGLYGRKGEQSLTQMINEMCALTGIKLDYVPESNYEEIKFENQPQEVIL